MSIDVTIERPLINVDIENHTVTVQAEPVSVGVTPGIEIVTTEQVTYTHVQSVPAATWTINHGLGRYPSVTVVTSAGDTVYGTVRYIDADTITITFAAGFSGKAHLN